jgi:hypothetical protein
VQQNVPKLVQASDLAQTISRRKLGFTYNSELSYSDANTWLADHVTNLRLLLASYPGD